MRILHKTIGRCLQERSRETPDRIAIEYESVTYSWSEIDRLSDYMAIRMSNYGVKLGDHAGIWSVNTPNFVIIYLALVKLGAVPVLINTCLQEEELVNIIRYADIQYLYYGDIYKELIYSDIVEHVKEHVSETVKRFISIGRDQGGRWIKAESFVSNEKTGHRLERLNKQKQQVEPNATASILFTSGTTSVSKGVMLTHLNLINTAYATVISMGWTMMDKLCVTVPLFHCFGLTSCLLAGMIAGGSLCLLPYYKTLNVLKCIQKFQCTVLNGVPSMFLAMIKNPAFADYNLSSLRTGIIAGSPILKPEYIKICEQLKSISLQPSYGQTETSPAVTFAGLDDSVEQKCRTVGKAISGVSVRIVDMASGQPVSAGQQGEIQVKGFNVMKGYYRLPEETKAALEPSGWLHTGDLGCLDEEGRLYITGRIKEMVIRSGENIAPREIEECLEQHPLVSQARVIGIPADVIQEEIIACVILNQSTECYEPVIRNYMKMKLAHYKVPARVLSFTTFPVSVTGKIQISELKKMVLNRLNSEMAAAGK